MFRSFPDKVYDKAQGFYWNVYRKRHRLDMLLIIA